MQLAQLEAFLEIAKQGSISRAAMSLYLTQPSVTNRLQALETEIGEPLFTRVKYGVTLTDAGKTLLPYAEQVVQTMEDGAAAIKNMRDATYGTLTIGASSIISSYFLPDVLELFSTDHPGVRVLVRTGHTDTILEKILNEEVQLALVYEVRHPDMICRRLRGDELILAVNPSHRFADRESVTTEEMANEGLILLGSATYHKSVNQVFAAAGLAPRVHFQIDNAEAAKMMVKRNLGIAVMHRLTVGEELQAGTLRAIPIEGDNSTKRNIAVIYPKAGGLGGIARAFLNCLEQFSDHMPDDGA